MKRVALPALLASAVLLCVAAAAWGIACRSVTNAMTAQARIATELLDAHARANESFARSLLRPGIHLSVVDAASGTAIDADAGGVVTHPLPGAGLTPGLPPPGGGLPPGDGLAPGTGLPPGVLPPGGGPPEDVPGAGALPGGGPLPARPARPRPLALLALNLLHTPPIRIARGAVVVRIAPDGTEIGTWLLCDVLAFVCGTIAIVAVASARWMGLARAERRALEARVTERREAADRYQRFLADIGHELRTPLTVMTGYVDILRGRESLEPLEPLDERIVDGMHAETSRMRTLVEKMMTLARLESHVSVPRLLDVPSAVADAAGILRRRYPEREVRIDANEHASIVIDADDYAAALGNILENAVKYAPRSPIAISVVVRNGSVTTTVVDEGPGIASDERHAIFERFYRGHATGEGLGLGLAIVKRITERWNGSVTCESESGRTVFGLRFPIADEETYEVAR